MPPRNRRIIELDQPSGNPVRIEVSFPRAAATRDGASAATPPSGHRLVPRSDGRQVRRLVAYFDPTLAKSLERWAVDNETDVSGAIVEAVRRMLGTT